MQRGKQAHARGESADHFENLISSVEDIFKSINCSDFENFCLWERATNQDGEPWGAAPRRGVATGHGTTTGLTGSVGTPLLSYDDTPHANDHHAQNPHRSAPPRYSNVRRMQA